MEKLSPAARPQTVTCSCGATCALTFSGERYYPLKAGWKFRTVAEAELYERDSGRRINVGWYCGQSDHYQKSFR